MLKKSLILFIFNILYNFSFAQYEYERKISWSNFDQQLMSEIVINQINHLRDSLLLPHLENDEILEKAALLQANFMAKSDKVTHNQSSKKFKEVRERVVYYDGDHDVLGECVANFQEISEETNSNITYLQAATNITKNWIKSKNDNKILINNAFYHYGVRFGINKKSKKIFATLVLGSIPLVIEGKHSPANAYEIGSYRAKDCKKCVDALDTLYKTHLTFGIIEKNGNAVFSFSDIDLFKKIFNSGNYYFTADLILKQQFECNKPNSLHGSPYHDGFLFKPISKSQILKNNLSKGNSVFTIIGKLPYEVYEQYELNLIVLKKRGFSNVKSHCVSYFPSPSYGFNLDIMPPNFVVDYDNLADSVLLKKKEIKFEIPFKKDKYSYSSDDIKPFVDSLNLNKFNITKIALTAYASVEGDSLYNLKLQKKRAESIAKAFQSYQKKGIYTKISTFENWQAFKKDIRRTSHSSLLLLSKEEIKKELKNDTLAKELETILSNHRKAIIKVSTEEKITYNLSPEELFNEYKKVINDTTIAIENKILIQKKLFNLILDKTFEYANLIEAPIQQIKQNLRLINNEIALKYVLKNEYPSFYECQELEKLASNEPKILVGIYAVIIQHWYKNPNLTVDFKKLSKGIEDLFTKSIISEGEYYKLMLNYNIAAANYFKHKTEHKLEKKAVKFVSSYYEKGTLSNKDAYILANFFVYHQQYKLAINTLLPKVSGNETDEDILFYYLSLAIFQNSQSEKEDFDQKMEKALEINQDRFCKLFGFPALSFQLMREKHLKNYFCESCQGNTKPALESIWKEGEEGENIMGK